MARKELILVRTSPFLVLRRLVYSVILDPLVMTIPLPYIINTNIDIVYDDDDNKNAIKCLNKVDTYCI